MNRSGLIGVKLGMSSYYLDDGSRLPVTLVRVSECEVIDTKTFDSHGYSSVVVGAVNCKEKHVSKPMLGVFNKLNSKPKKILKEFRVSESNLLESGFTFSPDYFSIGHCVDVSGLTIGKGFAGVMKRYNFRGLEASHGVSISHRSHGSTGQRQDPGKVFKGKKMAGHMGQRNMTAQNITVVDIDVESGLLILKGSIPGYSGSYVFVKDSVKKESFFNKKVGDSII